MGCDQWCSTDIEAVLLLLLAELNTRAAVFSKITRPAS
jgi:hypothetical protein